MNKSVLDDQYLLYHSHMKNGMENLLQLVLTWIITSIPDAPRDLVRLKHDDISRLSEC